MCKFKFKSMSIPNNMSQKLEKSDPNLIRDLSSKKSQHVKKKDFKLFLPTHLIIFNSYI